MDVQSVIDQVLQAARETPSLVGNLLSDPKATIEDITGQMLGEGDLSQIVSIVQKKFANGELDLSGIDLSQLDLSQLGGLGSMLGNSPIGGALGGIASGLGSFFSKR